jgi:hypothetical protein
LRREILYAHPEQFFSPRAGKEVDAALKAIEFKEKIVEYSGYDSAELAFTALVETTIDWNYNRASQTVAGWIPGMVSLMRSFPQIADPILTMKEGFLGVMKRTKGGEEAMRKWDLERKHPSEWPKSIAEAVSHDVKWSGAEGNAWDEFKAGGYLTTLETLWGYRTHEGEHHYKRLMKKYKGGFVGRVSAIPRKYWWIIPVATIALAATQSLEEEKGKSGGHSSH